MAAAIPVAVGGTSAGSSGDSPNPGMSIAITSWWGESNGVTGSHTPRSAPSGCTSTSGVPEPVRSVGECRAPRGLHGRRKIRGTDAVRSASGEPEQSAAARRCVTSGEMDLTGRTALVTGSNRGIGRAILEALAKEPLDLLLAGMRSPDSYEPTPVARAREVRPVRMDLSAREAIEESCAELGDQLGRIDVIVNNAGLVTGGLLEEQDLDEVYAMFQVNLVAVVQLTQAVLPGMIERGSGLIVNNASISGYAYFPAASTYAASKAGVVAFTESLRRELKDTGSEHAAPGHAGRGHGDARRHRGCLRPLHGHLGVGEAGARGVGKQGARGHPRRPHRAGPGRQGRHRQARLARARAS